MDFFAAAPLLVERLQARVPMLAAVLVATDATAAQESAQPTPAAHVIYLGYRIAEQQSGLLRIEQHWMTVIAVRDLRQTTREVPAQVTAGPLVGAVVNALAGWQPRQDHSALALMNGPAAAYAPGAAWIPLVWRTLVQWRSTTAA